jgi:hypothetical protein
MNQAKIDEMVADFYELAATEPEKHLEVFRTKIKHLTTDEMWEVMFIISNQVNAEIKAAVIEKNLAIAA